MISKKIIFHVPHACLDVPDFYLERLKVNRNYFDRINIYESDYLIDTFIPDDCNHIIFPYSRLFCDVERYRNDDDEQMARLYSRGVVYQLDSNKKEFIDIDEEYKNMIKNIYYDNHHSLLKKKIDEIISIYDECIIIDFHSFSDTYVYKTSKNSIDTVNPDICIGFNDFNNSKSLIKDIQLLCNKYKYTNTLNYPYSGSLIPLDYINDKRVISVMLEINKRLYLSDDLNKLDNHKSTILHKYMNELICKLV